MWKAAPSGEPEPIRSFLKDPDSGRVSYGQVQGGGGVQEGQQHLHQVVVPQELFHLVILPLEEFLDMVVFSWAG